MSSNLRQTALLLITLVLTGVVLRPLRAAIDVRLGPDLPTIGIESVGQGIAVAVLGGFRALMADFFWLRTHQLWEKRDLAATHAHLHLVTAIDPRPLTFWLNGARMIAYDMPAWRAAAADHGSVQAQPSAKFDTEQARVALSWLDAAERFHPRTAALWIERANIQLNRLRDIAAAAESYRRAALQPDAPYYAARLHAELLRRAGREAEAYAWLRAVHPSLPVDQEVAQASLVLVRIRELEQALGVLEGHRYKPPERRNGL